MIEAAASGMVNGKSALNRHPTATVPPNVPVWDRPAPECSRPATLNLNLI
jgi:hypothetical protein